MNNSLREAFDYIRCDEYVDLVDFCGPRNIDLIREAEEAIGVKFPKDYFDFLLAFGAGNIEATEIYGVINDDFVNSSVPDMVWCTLKDRQRGLPVDLIVIGGSELGTPCIKVNDTGTEAPVIAYYLGLPESSQTYEVLAENFGDYLLEAVKVEFEIE